MALLMDLPSELLEKIVFNTYHEDLVNFATTSRRIHALAEPALERHRELQTEYSRIFDTAGEGSLAKLVADIIEDPIIGLYVTHLEVHGLFIAWTTDYQGLGNLVHNEYPESTMSMLRKLIHNKSHLTDQSKDLWLKRLEKGNEEPVIALLLSLLPNLSTLRIMNETWRSTDSPCLHAALSEILANPSLSLLSKLHTVELQSNEYGFLHIFKRFIQIPSLRIMQASNLRASHYDTTLMHTSIERSNIKTLTFRECDIDTKLAASAIESTRGLECFSYVSLDREAQSQPEPYWIRGSLLASARDSLRFLQFLPHSIKEDEVISNNCQRYLGSLRGFRTLETVIVDCLLLFNGSLTGHHTFGTELPSSIRNLLLHVGYIETPSEDEMSSSSSSSVIVTDGASDNVGGTQEPDQGISSSTTSTRRVSLSQVISVPILKLALERLLDERAQYLPNLSNLRIVGLEEDVAEGVSSSRLRERFLAIGIAFDMVPKDSYKAGQFFFSIRNYACYKEKPWYHEDMVASSILD